MSDDDFALLLLRMGFIIEDRRQRVGKNRGRFLKGYAMLSSVGRGFVVIPLEVKLHQTPQPLARRMLYRG